MRYVIALFLLVACGSPPATITPTIIPTAMPPTAIPLSAIDLEPLLIQSGDLPAGIEGAQVRDVAPAMFDGMPKAAKTIIQQFAQGVDQIGGVSVFLYDKDNDRESAYQFIAKGMSNSDALTDTGDRAIVSKPIAAINFVDILFQRCAAVVHIRMSGEDLDRDAATIYARRLDKRLLGVVC